MQYASEPILYGGAASPPRLPAAQAAETEDAWALNQFRRFDGAGLWDIGRCLWRNRLLIGAVTVLLTGLATAALLQVEDRYTAKTTVMIEPRGVRLQQIDTVLPSPTIVDRETVESQIQVIGSRHLAGKVIDELDLAEHPDFAPGGLAALAGQLRAVLRRTLPKPLADLVPPADPARSPSPAGNPERELLIDALLKRVEITREGQSHVIGISATSRDPVTAASIANRFAELYLKNQVASKGEAVARAGTWLQDRLADLRETTLDAERAVERYRAQAGLIEGSNTGTITSQQLSELNTQLVGARARQAAARPRLVQAEQLIADTDALRTAPQVMDSETITGLRRREVELQQRIAEAQTSLGVRHPVLVTLKTELGEIQRSISAELQRGVAMLRNEVAALDAHERALAAAIDELQQSSAGLNERQVRLRELEREASANRALFEAFLGQSKETAAAAQLNEPDAQIVSPAEPPASSSFPNRGLFLALALAGSFGIGSGLALLLQQLDRSFRSTEQVEQHNLSVLAMVPAFGRDAAQRRRPGTYVVERPRSAFTEAMHSLKTSLDLGRDGGKPVLITSAYPGEGKTTLAVGFACSAAAAGRRVVLVDADLRRRSASRALGLADRPGLADVLSGEFPLNEALRTEPRSSLTVLPAGFVTGGVQQLLANPGLPELLSRLGNDHDLVVVDSPPVLAVSDTRLLASQAVQVVYVVRWGRTRRETVMAGLRQLVSTDARVAGIVLNAVDLRRYGGYASEAPDRERVLRAYCED